MREHRTKTISGLSSLLLLLGVLLAVPASAAATCTVDAENATMTVTVSGSDGAKIVRDADDDIVVTSGAGTTDVCGTTDLHTVFDIDTIIVNGSGPVTIDTSGGDFAPGFASETGTDEIEFYLASGLTLTVQGSTGPDNWTVTARGIGLNGDSDEDLTGGAPPTAADLDLVALILNGGNGDDTFEQTAQRGTKGEVINGGDDRDTVDYSARTAKVTVTIGNNTADDGEGGEKDDVKADVEVVIGGSAVAGDDLSAPATGTGSYQLEGGPGADKLTGGPGRDTLLGGADDDTLNAGDGRDTLNGGAGDDTENGEGGNDIFDQERAANGADKLNGGEPTDTNTTDNDAVRYTDRETAVRVSVDGTANDGACTGDCGTATENDNVATDVESVFGGDGGDSLIAAAAGSRLSGGNGNDKLTGGAARDRLVGGAGDDRAGGGGGNDYVAGSGDNDRLVGGAGDDTLSGGSEDDVMNGEAGTDRVSGSSGADSLWGGKDHKDVISGGSGTDKCENDRPDQRSGCEKIATTGAPTSQDTP